MTTESVTLRNRFKRTHEQAAVHRDSNVEVAKMRQEVKAENDAWAAAEADYRAGLARKAEMYADSNVVDNLADEWSVGNPARPSFWQRVKLKAADARQRLKETFSRPAPARAAAVEGSAFDMPVDEPAPSTRSVAGFQDEALQLTAEEEKGFDEALAQVDEESAPLINRANVPEAVSAAQQPIARQVVAEQGVIGSDGADAAAAAAATTEEKVATTIAATSARITAADAAVAGAGVGARAGLEAGAAGAAAAVGEELTAGAVLGPVGWALNAGLLGYTAYSLLFSHSGAEAPPRKAEPTIQDEYARGIV